MRSLSVVACLAQCALLLGAAATPAFAQRDLYWDTVDVAAHLDASGRLRVEETQTMVFDGDWNGGERRFDIRPRQQFRFLGLYRDVGGTWQPLTEDDALDDIDEYSWVDRETLRWRSRLPSDDPFQRTRIRYQLRYEFSNILLKDGDGYSLDHDFLFADRDGVIRRFDLKLTFDEAWQSRREVREIYQARDIAPGDGFVLTLPLAYSGAAVPATLDTSRPRDVQLAVFTILGITGAAILWLFIAESARGRFAPLAQYIDESWLAEHILKHPAEVIGAAWDETIASPEVVALIARLVKEGKLESAVGKKDVMTLRLKVGRDTLQGRERTLIDKLFFNNRTTTNTQLVKQHYRTQGFNPADVIAPDLKTAVNDTVPEGERRRPFRFATSILLPVGLVLLIAEWTQGRLDTGPLLLFAIGTLVLSGVALGVGSMFRSNVHWSRRAAVACLLPALVSVLLAVGLLWLYVGGGEIAASPLLSGALTLLTLAIVSANINAMVSRQHPAGVAFRRKLGAGREFFIKELAKPQPALRDEWFPWLLALGLGKQMDDWSAQQHGSDTSGGSRDWSSSASGTTSTSSSPSTWTGFAGGRSGGAGGGAAWTTAASGLAAGVSPPSSSSSGGGSSSSSSSSGGSSGGGGGGGW